jgi:hypothetical protein
MMKSVLILILFLTPALCMSQEIGIGIISGLESRSSAMLETEDVGLLARSEGKTPVFLPEVEFGYQLSDVISVGLGLSYRKETLSISAWNPKADTCRLCPVIKGGGPSAREIRLRPSAQLKFYQRGHSALFLSFGMIWALRFGPEANLSHAPDSFRPLFHELPSAIGTNPLYFQGGIGLSWKRISGQLRYEHTSAYSERVKISDGSYPFQLSESRLLFYLSYRFKMSRG